MCLHMMNFKWAYSFGDKQVYDVLGVITSKNNLICHKKKELGSIQKRDSNCLFLLQFLCSMKLCILFNATWRVSSLMLAKQTLNQPGSEQWHDEPGEMLSFTSWTIASQRANSLSLVWLSKNGLKFIQQNNPPFPFKHSIPAFFRPLMIISYLFLSLCLFVLM